MALYVIGIIECTLIATPGSVGDHEVVHGGRDHTMAQCDEDSSSDVGSSCEDLY